MTTNRAIHLPGPNQKQKNTARADGSLLHGLAASARIKRKGKSSELLNGLKVFQHSSARALLVLAVVFSSALVPLDAGAFTGTVRRIVIQAATTAELDDTVLEPGLLVYRVDDPKDVRIGDGMAAGGIRLWNFAALTNPPPVYDRDLDMAGHGIVLNGHYTVKAEGGYLSVYHVGTNPVFRLTGSEAAGHLGILAWDNSGTNVVLTVQHIEGDDPPVLEAAGTLTDPIWTAVDYELVRLSPVLVSLTFPQPELGAFTYYRVATSVTAPSASFFVPVYVNGAAVLTAETDPSWTSASGSVVYAAAAGYTAAVQQAAAAYGWGDHADGGYLTAETDPHWSAASGSVVYVESDPVASAALSHYLSLTGGLMNGSINMSGNAITNVGHIYAEDGMDLYPGSSYGVLHGEWHVDSISVGAGAVISNWSKFLSLTNNAGITELDLVGGTSQPTRILFGWNDSIQFGDNEVFYNGHDLWDEPNGTNIWRGGIADPEVSRIRTMLSALSASGTVTIAANTTNYFLRPDGKTNSVSFDGDGNMLVVADGTTALTVRTNGNVGIKNTGSGTYPLYVTGDIYSTSRVRATDYRDTGDSTRVVDPSGESIMSAAKVDTLTATGQRIYMGTQTNCWLVTDGTNLFFRNVAGTTNAITSN